MTHDVPVKRSAPYRLTGMEHTGICGMGHTTFSVNGRVLKSFANERGGSHWRIGGIDAPQLLSEPLKYHRTHVKETRQEANTHTYL